MVTVRNPTDAFVSLHSRKYKRFPATGGLTYTFPLGGWYQIKGLGHKIICVDEECDQNNKNIHIVRNTS